QIGEPYLHFAWRRLAGLDLAGADPVGAIARRVDAIDTRAHHLDLLIARTLDAIAGKPHAAHHLWIDLPDPRPAPPLVSRTRCDQRYVDLAVWPKWDGAPPGAVVEHVLGQLLFATRFGPPPASCREVTVHWGAPPDACARLVADPTGFLADAGALDSVRD